MCLLVRGTEWLLVSVQEFSWAVGTGSSRIIGVGEGTTMGVTVGLVSCNRGKCKTAGAFEQGSLLTPGACHRGLLLGN